MREYGKISPQFWIGKTGKALRGNVEAQIVAVYLMTSPHSEMNGVFNCPILYIAHETGLTMEGASKGLKSLIELDFCTFEDEADTVFVHEMAKYQIGDELKPADNRVISVKKYYQNMPEGRIKTAFYSRYKDSFYLENSPLKTQAPSKPLVSQEHKQEQEKEHKQEKEKTSAKAPKFDFVGALKELGVPEVSIAAWMEVRKRKNGVNTEVALNAFKREAAKAGLSIADAVLICAERSWSGLEAEWFKPKTQASPQKPSVHNGFDKKDYSNGVNDDGSF